MAKDSGLYLDHFVSGLYTNRSALTTPKTGDGAYAVAHLDTLIDGSNLEITPRKTLGRRPGFPTFCSQAFAGGSEWPLNYWGGRLAGNLLNLVDTQTAVYTFTTSALALVFTKSTTGQSFFQQVGNALYFSDGSTNKRWDGTTVTNSGITAPTVAPAIANLNLHDLVGFIQTVHCWSPNYSYTGAASGILTLWLKDTNGNMQFAFLNPTQIAKSGNSSPTWSTTTGGTTRDGDLTWTNSGGVGTWATGMTTFKTAFGSSGIQNLFSGPNLPTSFAQSGSTEVWSGSLPGALSASTTTNGNTTKILDLTGLGFAVPTAGGAIVGVKAEVLREHIFSGGSLGSGSVTDLTIQLLKASAATGSNKAASGFWPGNGSVTKTYGNATDLWGATLAPADINAAGFGLRIQATFGRSSGTHTARVYSVKITVYYSVTSITAAFTSTVIVDSNGNLQRISTSGAVGGSAPAWATTIGTTTADSSAVWECLGTGLVLAANVGWNYGYGFHTTSVHLSTMSPLLALVAPIIGKGVTLTGPGSDDTQCDRNDLYRNTDGGALLFYDASDNNVNSATTWSIFDNVPDVNLNNLLVGPIAHVNDPPPAGLTNIKFYMGRMWGSVGNLLYFSAGQDCTNGDGFQSWPPANVFTMSSTIQALAPTSQGLVVFTQDQMRIILGGPQTLTFFDQPILKTIGLLSPNCMDQDGDTVYAYTSGQQLFKFSFSGKEEVGYAVADLVATNFSAVTSSLTLHRSGLDEGVFLSDGASKVIRLSLRFGCWSPVGTITGGINRIMSVETSAGVYTLMAGRPTGSGNLLGRSTTSFLDGASSYTGFGTIGSLVLSPPGNNKVVSISNIVLEYPNTGTDWTLAVLPNEISGAFTTIPFNVTDPYQLAGTAFASTTVKMRRHDWKGVATPLPNAIKHIQIKVSLPAANTADELVYLGINPDAV